MNRSRDEVWPAATSGRHRRGQWVPPRAPGYDIGELIEAQAWSASWAAHRRADDLDLVFTVIDLQGRGLIQAMGQAGSISRVRHEHLLRLYDVLAVTMDPPEDGRRTPAARTERAAEARMRTPPAKLLGLATERPTGGTLAELIDRRRALSVAEMVTVIAPLATALSELHAEGVVHGGICPASVGLTDRGRPMLGSLGPVSLVSDQSRLRRPGTAPELLEGGRPTPDSDVFALGSLAWICLLGRTPAGATAPQLETELQQLLAATLAPEPADRPDAGALGRRLLELERPAPIRLHPPEPGRSEAVAATRRRERAIHPKARVPQPAVRPRRRLAVVGAGATLVLAVTTGVIVGPGNLGSWATGRPEPAPQAVGVAISPPIPAAPVHPAPGDPAVDEPTVDEPTVDDLAVDDLAPLVSRLAQARADAWTQSDPDLLEHGLAPDSPAQEDDLAALQIVGEGGYTYRGLQFEVAGVELLAAGTGRGETGDADWLEVRVEVVTAPFTVLDAVGQQTEYPEQRTTAQIELHRSDDDSWLIYRWW